MYVAFLQHPALFTLMELHAFTLGSHAVKLLHAEELLHLEF